MTKPTHYMFPFMDDESATVYHDATGEDSILMPVDPNVTEVTKEMMVDIVANVVENDSSDENKHYTKEVLETKTMGELAEILFEEEVLYFGSLAIIPMEHRETLKAAAKVAFDEMNASGTDSGCYQAVKDFNDTMKDYAIKILTMPMPVEAEGDDE